MRSRRRPPGRVSGRLAGYRAGMAATPVRGGSDEGRLIGRRESEHTRLTRNLHELLQELRVTQTGVQILTGFLLTLPFSNRFALLTPTQKYVYLAVLVGSVVSTGMIVAPVGLPARGTPRPDPDPRVA